MPLGTLIRVIQDIMRKDVGVDGDAQRISQVVWLLFLKIFDDKEQEWNLTIDGYVSPLQSRFRWRNWAKDPEGVTGDELTDFVNQDLFPSLKLLATTSGVSAQGRVIGSVFEDAYNYMKSGTLLRQVINTIEEDVDFNSSTDRHLFNDIYERILADLQSAGNAGEYYTPRAVTQFMVDILDPRLGESVMDPACGTGGFLTCAIEHLKKQVNTSADDSMMQASIHGVEKKPLPHMLAMTNMMLHGIDVPTNVRHGNTLSRPLKDYGPKDRVDVIITNPPFGGVEENGIEKNFPKKYQTRETADLFMALIMHRLQHDGGRGAVVLPDGFLFGEGVKSTLKRELLEEFNLHTIVRLPKGVFSPYTGIATNLLFFEKGGPTKDVWFFEHPYPSGYKSYSRTKPLALEEFALEKAWWGGSDRTGRKVSEFAWKISAKEIVANNFSLDFSNPFEAIKEEANPDILHGQNERNLRELAVARDQLRVELLPIFEPATRALVESNFEDGFATRDGIEKLRQLILQMAMKGSLVPQDLHEASAFDILEQIRISRFRDGKEMKSSFPKTSQALPEGLAKLPHGWRWVALADISDYIQRGKGPTYSEQREVPVISQKSIQWKGFDKDVVKYIDPSTLSKYQPERFVRAGDLLWNSTGTGTIGRINIYQDELAEYSKIVADSHVTVVRLVGVSNRFVLNYLKTPSSQLEVLEKATGTTNQIEMNTTFVVNKTIPLPPLEEQHRIVQKLDQLMDLCADLERKLRRTHAVRDDLLGAIVARA